MRQAVAILVSLLATACAGDFSAAGSLPSCNARPVSPPDYSEASSTEVERPDRTGTRLELRGPEGRRLVFHLGARPGLPRLPSAGSLLLATTGSGRLSGAGTTWVFAWEDQFPCTQMAVVGTGLKRPAFVQALGFAQLIPFEAEEGAEEGESEELEELLEGEEGEGETGVAPGGPSAEWVAAFASAPRRGELDPVVEDLTGLGAARPVVRPASCWKGLPAALGVPRTALVAALVALTDHELDFALQRTDRTPVVRAIFRTRCPG